MDPYTVLGVTPGASKADIKKEFFRKAKEHHPDMHSNASEGVKKANDAAFRVLNDAYQALMNDTHRYQRRAAGARARSGAASSYYGHAAGAAGTAGAGGGYNPFESSYAGGSYSGYRQYRQRSGLDFRGAFRAFTSIGRAEAAATAAMGLLLAGGVLLLEDTSQSLWARHNQGKLFDSIQQDYEHKKQQKEAAAADAAAALRAASAAMREQAAAAAADAAQQQEKAAAAAAVAVLPGETARSGGSSSGGGSGGSARVLQSTAGGAAMFSPPASSQVVPDAAAAEDAGSSSREGSEGSAVAPALLPGEAAAGDAQALQAAD